MSVDRIGKFQVLDTLGAGAHSSILRILRVEDGREYALKIVPVDGDGDKKYLDQLRHEHRVGHMLDHPSLVKVYCLETESDWLFRVKKGKLLIEYVPGTTLDKVPLILINGPAGARIESGRQADIAPTLLDLLGLPKPVEMTGRNLLVRTAARAAAE